MEIGCEILAEESISSKPRLQSNNETILINMLFGNITLRMKTI